MSLRPIRCLSMARDLAGAVLLAVLVSGCAGTPKRGGGPGGHVDPERPSFIDIKAGSEEAANVAARVWAVASGVRDVDSRLEFTFWSEQGALTLTNFVAENRGGKQGKPTPNAEALQREVTRALVAAMKHPAREVYLRLHRGESSWRVESSDVVQTFRPTGARTLPLRQGALPPRQTSNDIAAAVRAVLSGVKVPAEGTVAVDLTAHVRNGRMVGLRLTDDRVLRSGYVDKPRPVAPQVSTEVANLILLYAPCTRTRSIHLGLRLTHRGNAMVATGGVEETRVDLTSLPGDEDLALRLPR
ncbi:hypothetical protein HPC49_00180 [Pyxidicoccus fallax]|uniref:Lipoprotein n=1 Tax=Pyxidicoccus fallax TaxID=394095 RepID=A0A848L663_9BACT|nr:hypothetical protein [Pyxidicoccus fallax]NMO13997.1 hypothetical protein [Pyxidicoccus fallax]NPC76671.1 hypothetical protein [Pyxidicoccus fallax]